MIRKRPEFELFRGGICILSNEFSDRNSIGFRLEYDHFPMRLCAISGRDFQNYWVEILLFSDWNMTTFLCDYVHFRV